MHDLLYLAQNNIKYEEKILEAKSDKGMELGQKEEKYREEKVHKGLKG
jgi:hypothetical protein